MPDQYATRRRFAAQSKLWIDLRHRIVPAKPPLTHQLCQQKCRHALSVGGDHESCVRIYGLGFAQLAHSDTSLIDHFPAGIESKTHPGDVDRSSSVADKVHHLLHSLRIECVRLAVGKGFALVSRWSQTRHDLIDGGDTLFRGSFVAVENHHGPRCSFAPCNGKLFQVLARRGLIADLSRFLPTLTRRHGGQELERMRGSWSVGCPGSCRSLLGIRRRNALD